MIFNIGVRNRIVRSVELVCPRCGLDRTGAQVAPHRWVYVLGIPVLPLGEHDPVVICDECQHASDLGVLDVPTTEQLTKLLEDATVGAFVRAIRSSDADREAAIRARAESTLNTLGYGHVDVWFDAAVEALPDQNISYSLRSVGRELTPFGKQGFLHRVTALVMTEMTLSPTQRESLRLIGKDLGMAAPHINGVLAVASVHAEV